MFLLNRTAFLESTLPPIMDILCVLLDNIVFPCVCQCVCVCKSMNSLQAEAIFCMGQCGDAAWHWRGHGACCERETRVTAHKIRLL